MVRYLERYCQCQALPRNLTGWHGIQKRKTPASSCAATTCARRTLTRNTPLVPGSRAEKLVGFMIVDLRDKLESVARFRLLDDVNRNVKEYFQSLAGSKANQAINIPGGRKPLLPKPK